MIKGREMGINMLFCFWKRIRIAPPACRGASACGAGMGMTLNSGKAGGSLLFELQWVRFTCHVRYYLDDLC